MPAAASFGSRHAVTDMLGEDDDLGADPRVILRV
jgi:hypothetical protein